MSVENPQPENTNWQKKNNEANEHEKSGQQRFKAEDYENKENSFNPETQPGGKSGINQGHGPGEKNKGQHGGNR
jgi:hypothetical protein